MPKTKTHSGTSKRVKVTANGDFKHKRANLRHRLRNRSTRQKRALNIDALVKPCNDRLIRNMMKLRNPKRVHYVWVELTEEEANQLGVTPTASQQ